MSYFHFSKLINGFQFLRNKQDLPAYFFQDKKNVLSKLVIQTNKPLLINDYFEYMKFINNHLTSAFVLQSKNELDFINKRSMNTSESHKSSSESRGSLSAEMLLNRYINTSANGSKLFILKRPTLPEKKSPKIIFILALSIVLGGIIGVLFVLLKKTIHKRKESAYKV